MDDSDEETLPQKNVEQKAAKSKEVSLSNPVAPKQKTKAEKKTKAKVDVKSATVKETVSKPKAKGPPEKKVIAGSDVKNSPNSIVMDMPELSEA